MRAVLRWTGRIAAAVLILAVIAGAAGYGYLRQSLPQTSGEIDIAAVDAPVTVTRDDHGIPTIAADSRRDAHAALGFLHAQDRLMQLAMVRRVAHGKLSELAGAGTLRIDKLMRILGFRELAKKQLQHLSEPTRAALDAYADGVNAFLARDPVLPPVLQVVGEPEPWTAADSLAWLHIMQLQLSGNWREEITNARLADRLSPSQIDTLRPSYPETAATTILSSLDLPLGELASLLPKGATDVSASNAWAVDGTRTAGGGPMLANDPHLRLQTPGYWYLARIETPEMTLVGATSPGIPFHVAGRNQHLAWGLTTTHSDTQDLFIEKLAPQNRDRYRVPGGTRAFETRTEHIAVRGEDEPVTVEVRRSRHGPVISDAVPEAGAATRPRSVLALAWPALRPDDRTLDAIRSVNAASSVDAALTALDHAGAPQQNIFLADDAGNIAVTAPARVPVRKNGNGMLPIPGWEQGRGWERFIPRDALPQSVNPERGRLVNANNRLVADAYPYSLAAHWPPPDRAERIGRLLDRAERPLTLDAMEAIQLDTMGAAPRLLRDRLLRLAPASGETAPALDILRQWDGGMATDTAAPLIFTAWLDMLNRALFAEPLGPLFTDFARPEPRRLRRALAGAGGWCRDAAPEDTAGPCARVAGQALETALTRLEDRFGGDVRSWRWGDAHRTTLPHTLLSRVPVLGGLLHPDLATPGGDETVNRGGMRYSAAFGERYEHVHGAGLRSLHDLSRPPGSSRFMIAGGQSSNPLSPHYMDLARPWRDGKYLKLVGDSKASDRTLRLLPAHHSPER
ncbi:penicillin amidase [Limimonas halophila]|uniref:Penicillin amidase n=1 Tax=Limimonas halophila TaxID=1082479 RepID=A0A1G7N4Q4_9PROT|nr:penicillin acylase family protein [Limimonas halophila]SDF68310.1 penicillin amidase [Limimonas halophila]